MSATLNAQPKEMRHIFFRISIGSICFVFLVVLIFGRMIFEGFGFNNSISDYYYSPSMHNVFVGGLCILAVLLMCYRYGKVDTLASLFAGICAIGVAIFPKSPDPKSPECQTISTKCPTDLQTGIGTAHYVFAALFLITIALMAIFLFTQSDQPKPIGRKKHRNWVYQCCGIAMIILIIGCPVQQFFLAGNMWLQGHHPILWFETVTLLLFIIVWIVKGEVLLKDKNQGMNYLSEYLKYLRNILPKAIEEFRTIFLAKSSPDKSGPTPPQPSMSPIESYDTIHPMPESPSDDPDEQLKDLGKRVTDIMQAFEIRKGDMVRSGKTVPDIIANIEKEFMLPLKILLVPVTLQEAPDDLTRPQEQAQHYQGNPASDS